MKKELSDAILKEIEKRNVGPLPRWRFLFKRVMFWIFGSLSVVTGAISFAVAYYVYYDQDFKDDHDYISLLLTQQPLVDDIVKGIPFLWIILVAGFTAFAYYSFRHTKRGYRYATTVVVIASLIASVLLGLVLNTIDIGQYIHRYLVENVHGYNTLVHSSEDNWIKADKGWLGGKIIHVEKKDEEIRLRDFKRRLWLIDIKNTVLDPGTEIAVGKYYKITGVRTGKRTFKALSIKSWEKKKAVKKILPPTLPKDLQQHSPAKIDSLRRQD